MGLTLVLMALFCQVTESFPWETRGEFSYPEILNLDVKPLRFTVNQYSYTSSAG